MTYGCPNTECAFYLRSDHIKKDGSYYRREDSRAIRRFKCNFCNKRFSQATHSLEFRQKKRRINHTFFQLISSGISQRRCARILNIHRTTVKRKFLYLARKAELKNKKFLNLLEQNPVTHLQFDDLITSIHTKLKPASVTIAIDAKTRIILGIEAGSLPAFGHLAKLSRKKYGHRQNEHRSKIACLFSRIEKNVSPQALIESDEHQNYAPAVQAFFPQASYKQYKGGRGAIAGQGELKKLNYDPLFKINHTCAMLRANINRLIRKTWCTSKNLEMLKKHLNIYVWYHNQFYLK